MSNTPSPPPGTPRVDSMTITPQADGSAPTQGIYYYAGSAPVPSGVVTIRPNQYTDWLGQAQVKLNPLVWVHPPTITPAQLVTWIQAQPSTITLVDVMTHIASTGGPIVPGDVARIYHDFKWTEYLPPETNPAPVPQPIAVPAIT